MSGLPSPTKERTTTDEDYGPHKYGAELIVNGPPPTFEAPFAIDVETDERDGFVGIALCGSASSVYYYTHLGPVQELLEQSQIIGHNLKGDLKWLKSWGVNVTEKNLDYDTMIASYVTNPTRESHGLKPVSKVILGFIWPSYTDLTRVVTNGRKRKGKTLDQLPVDVVARYCGMDCLATFKLWQHFSRNMTPNHRRVFQGIEMPINRILYQMENRGVRINLSFLSELDKEFAGRIAAILATIKELTEKDIEKLLMSYRLEQLKEKWEQTGYKAFQKNKVFNPGSWQQKRLLLKFMGLELESTDKKELIKYKDENKLINLLLQHSEFAKLYDGFITTFKELPTLPYIHTTFNQVSEDSNNEDNAHGIRTGRFSSKNPNLQQIPARTDNGKLLRKLFIPRDGHTFVVADYSQIELRLAAHFSHDPILLQAFRTGKNIHTATGEALGVDRDKGKLANFLIQYGGSAWALSERLNMPYDEAEEFIWKVKDTYKVFELWKDRTINAAKARLGVNTIVGRWIPCEKLKLSNALNEAKATLPMVNAIRARKGRKPLDEWQLAEKIIQHEERVAISKIIQGSAADIMKLSMLETVAKGYPALLTVHDELLFEIAGAHNDDEYAWGVQDDIKAIMENVIKLDVPLEISIGHGPNWGEAKH